MSELRLDDCEHCACVTHLPSWLPLEAIRALEARELGCWNCEDQDEDHHTACVVLYNEAGVALWDGRCRSRQ